MRRLVIAAPILYSLLWRSGCSPAEPYTPPRAGFLNEILERPENERPFVVLPVGYPAKDAKVPDIKKKTLDELATFV